MTTYERSVAEIADEAMTELQNIIGALDGINEEADEIVAVLTRAHDEIVSIWERALDGDGGDDDE